MLFEVVKTTSMPLDIMDEDEPDMSILMEGTALSAARLSKREINLSDRTDQIDIDMKY